MLNLHSPRRPSAHLLAIVILAGCGGGSGPDIVPVLGRITVDGEPLVGVRLVFKPAGTPGPSESVFPAFATTDEDGRYELRLAREPDRLGAKPGDYTVIFEPVVDPSIKDVNDPRILKASVPRPYRGGVPFTVPEQGTDAADFVLTSS